MSKLGIGFDVESVLQIPLDFVDVTYANGQTIRYRKEPKQGKWIFRPYADYNPTMGDIVCSKCECVYFEGVPESRIKYKLYNFCPNCGARMKEGDEK